VPLAQSYRPQRFEDLLGQPHLVGPDGIIRKLVESRTPFHAFLYGPPGCGKTTLARLIAKHGDAPFYEMNATSLKIDEVRKVFKTHAQSLQKPLLFIDEVHRLSKNQQEVLLPHMERFDAIIIGASTENPYYALTAAMRSRAHLFELKAIDKETMHTFLEKVLRNEGMEADEDARAYLVDSSGGDMRAMLNLLEAAAAIDRKVTRETLIAVRPVGIQAGSSEADAHYELTSALIKSVRGSDIDAALYYLARLIEGGEPPEFIARRLAILASEDIGNANPNALNLAASTLTIVKNIGYPEARIPLAQLTVYLASSPKSNSAYKAINAAQKTVREGKLLPVPDHIKTHPRNYRYPHDFGGWVEQDYLTEPLRFYESDGIGFEKTLLEWHRKITRS
jgi:putative ATPase